MSPIAERRSRMNGIIIWSIGAILGSFIALCFQRMSRGESIVWPRSHCESCGQALTPIELIPIVSYIGLKGKCLSCGKKIDRTNWWVEILVSLLFLWTYFVKGVSIEMVWIGTFICLGVLLSWMDMRYLILPTHVIRIGFCMAIIELCVWHGIGKDSLRVLSCALGACLGFSIFLVFHICGEYFCHKEILGVGDVRLMGLIGIFVGIEGIFPVFIWSGILGIIYGLMLWMKKKESTLFPFGPFLCAGTYLVMMLY